MQAKIDKLLKIYRELDMIFPATHELMKSFTEVIIDLKSYKPEQKITRRFKTGECAVCASKRYEGGPIPDLIILKIAELFDVTPELIKGRSREEGPLYARHLVCFLLRKELKYSLQKTARYVNLNHSTVLNSCKTAENLMDSIVGFKNKKELAYTYLSEIIKTHNTLS